MHSYNTGRHSSGESNKHQGGLMRFFDSEDNWSESTVPVGRPWMVEELRLKSNQDLHKLWLDLCESIIK